MFCPSICSNSNTNNVGIYCARTVIGNYSEYSVNSTGASVGVRDYFALVKDSEYVETNIGKITTGRFSLASNSTYPSVTNYEYLPSCISLEDYYLINLNNAAFAQTSNS
jgi:hypothetical protein